MLAPDSQRPENGAQGPQLNLVQGRIQPAQLAFRRLHLFEYSSQHFNLVNLRRIPHSGNALQYVENKRIGLWVSGVNQCLVQDRIPVGGNATPPMSLRASAASAQGSCCNIR